MLKEDFDFLSPDIKIYIKYKLKSLDLDNEMYNKINDYVELFVHAKVGKLIERVVDLMNDKDYVKDNQIENLLIMTLCDEIASSFRDEDL